MIGFRAKPSCELAAGNEYAQYVEAALNLLTTAHGDPSARSADIS